MKKKVLQKRGLLPTKTDVKLSLWNIEHKAREVDAFIDELLINPPIETDHAKKFMQLIKEARSRIEPNERLSLIGYVNAREKPLIYEDDFCKKQLKVIADGAY